MKKTMRFLSMAALALVGAVMTGCSSDDNVIEQQPENSGKVTTLKTTISFDDGATTRALTSGGVKTFAVGDQVAIVFEDGKSRTWTALSNALTAGDIRNSGKTADITVDIFSQLGTTQANNGAVRLIYPANMAKTFSGTSDAINNDNTIDFTKLNAQDGTLDNLGSSLDLCTFDGNFTAIGELPTSITLTNKLAVCALTLQNSDGSSTITSGLTEVTVSDGSNTYTVTPTGSTFGEDVIYVAIRPVEAALEYTATDGTNNYTKTATSREYAAGNIYNLGLRMTEQAPAAKALSAATSADYGKVVCAAGHLHTAKTAVPAGCTAVGILGKVTETGHGLILALQDATSQTWNTINGWTSVTTYAGTTLQVLPDDAARGSLASYTALGETTVSNWAVAQKSDYEAIFENLGSTAGDSDGKGYDDNNVNLFITTGVGGSELSGDYWSATNDPNLPWVFGNYWFHNPGSFSNGVRPVLGFSLKDPAPAGPTAYTLAESTQGMIVGTDGKAYDAADKDNLPSGVTAAGVVVYKNGANGLAIALEDEANKMDWDTARGENGAAAHTPAVEGYSWVLPSKDQWQNMIDAAGGYDALRDGFEGVGGTNLQSDESARYWSSTVFDSSQAWRIYFYNGIWNFDYKDESRYVRACLAF